MDMQYGAIEFDPLAGARQTPRTRTLFVVGKLTRGCREHVCRVRNISENGVGIEHDADIAVGDGVTIELRGLSQADAVVRWVKGGMAGLEFVEPVQFEAVSETNARTLRSPRFKVDRCVNMQIDDQPMDMHVLDIALGGMKVAAGGLQVGSATMIGLHGHELLMAGRICWSSRAASGVQFNRPLATPDLIAILRVAVETRHGPSERSHTVSR